MLWLIVILIAEETLEEGIIQKLLMGIIRVFLLVKILTTDGIAFLAAELYETIHC